MMFNRVAYTIRKIIIIYNMAAMVEYYSIAIYDVGTINKSYNYYLTGIENGIY